VLNPLGEGVSRRILCRKDLEEDSELKRVVFLVSTLLVVPLSSIVRQIRIIICKLRPTISPESRTAIALERKRRRWRLEAGLNCKGEPPTKRDCQTLPDLIRGSAIARGRSMP